ncbi:DUF2007 domain-containing protein [Sphingomonas sp. KRR8]|uniref:putative signal transducing protein n=1 Tax=Sphingomonas sp. KRR8 TaxID=2942996 RepID=UPI002021B4BA|nr:DUF2007 domain-containing protein [Sphingomonas sp. KRR8]URD60251.1 DUF2007 domain-containing protein [Sphingomonas sp. KRR8]
MSLVELARYESQITADLARLTLERAGIDAVLFDSAMHGYIGVGWLMPVRLMVLDGDQDEAWAILRADGLLPPG